MPARSSLPAHLRDRLHHHKITAAGQADAPVPVAAITGLAPLLSAMVDFRGRRGRRHALSPILVLAVWAVAAGATSWVAIADHARYAATADLVAIGMRSAGPPARRGAHRVGVPSMATIRRVLIGIDAQALEAVLRTWAAARIAAATAAVLTRPPTQRPSEREQRPVLSLDGKTERGSRTPRGPALALVSAFHIPTGLVATQVPVVAGNEIAAVATALTTLDSSLTSSPTNSDAALGTVQADGRGGLAGAVIVADALHCQHSHARYLLERGAHFIFRARGNQPTLSAAIAAQAWAEVPRLRTRDRGHGRVESRSIWVLSVAPGSWDELMPGTRQVIKMHRRRSPLDGPTTGALKPITAERETVYFATSLDYNQAPPELLAAWIRAEWQIENRVHHVRDVTFREDASRVRSGAGPQVMAALRNTAINLAHLDEQANIAAAHREYAADSSALLGRVLAA